MTLSGFNRFDLRRLRLRKRTDDGKMFPAETLAWFQHKYGSTATCDNRVPNVPKKIKVFFSSEKPLKIGTKPLTNERDGADASDDN